MARIGTWGFAILLAFCLVGCGGSEYRFGNSQHTLTAVTLTPSAQTLTNDGQTVQFIATGSYSSAPTAVDITSLVQWASSTPSVATVSSTGLAAAVSNGDATISASYAGVTGSSTLTVKLGTSGTRTLSTITVVPSAQTLMTVGEHGQFLAVGTYTSYPLSEDLTNQVTWLSSDTTVATVNFAGLTNAVSLGSASIIAETGGVVGTSNITVTSSTQPHELTALTVIPTTNTSYTNVIGETVQYVAVGSFIGDPTTQDMTNQVTWSSSDVRVATIDNTGLATSIGNGGGANPQVTTIIATAVSNTNATITGTSDLHVGSSGNNDLPTLTVYIVGQGKGDVVNVPPPQNLIQCGADYPQAGCSAHLTKGVSLVLTATPSQGSLFGGFSANCVPIPDSCSAAVREPWVTSCSCGVTMNDNVTVGTIFDLQH